jgi:putative autoinducer-2 (AI-2) aldolase
MEGSWAKRIGMIRRLSRVYRDGKSLILAADHRQRGIQEGLEDFARLSSNLLSSLRYADALMATKEPIAHLISKHDLGSKGLLLSLNRTGLAGTPYEMDDREVASPELAARWGLDGAKLLLRIDPEDPLTSDQLERCGRICERCEELELPLILEPLYCRKTAEALKVQRSSDEIRKAAIIANDFSVPAIKIPYPEASTKAIARQAFRDLLNSVSCEVLVLGGRKGALKNLLEVASDAMGEGASGLVIGRNVLQHQNPSFATAALGLVVHEGLGAEIALKQAAKLVSE